MNFNVYLDAGTAKQLNAAARRRRKARNAIVRQAVQLWLVREGAGWLQVVRDFVGDPTLEPFEKHRPAVTPPPSDPFA